MSKGYLLVVWSGYGHKESTTSIVCHDSERLGSKINLFCDVPGQYSMTLDLKNVLFPLNWPKMGPSSDGTKPRYVRLEPVIPLCFPWFTHTEEFGPASMVFDFREVESYGQIQDVLQTNIDHIRCEMYWNYYYNVIEQNDIYNAGSKNCPNESPFYLNHISISSGQNHMIFGLF